MKDTTIKPTPKVGDEIYVHVKGPIKCIVDHFSTDGVIVCDAFEYLDANWRDGRWKQRIEK